MTTVNKPMLIWRQVQGMAVRVHCPNCRVIVPLGDASRFLRGDSHWVVRRGCRWRCVWCLTQARAGDELACAEVLNVC